ncbi:universal stress protein [Vibrio sp.]|nr:universal stress protein [Vibrio sp.]
MSYQHILVAVDLSDSSRTLIEKAIGQAKPNNSELSLVYVDIDHVVEEPREEQRLKRQLQTLADECGYPVQDTDVVIGDLHMKLAGMVKSSDIDLVVCGHHHKFMSRMLTAVPKLVNSVEADLLVVYLEH